VPTVIFPLKGQNVILQPIAYVLLQFFPTRTPQPLLPSAAVAERAPAQRSGGGAAAVESGLGVWAAAHQVITDIYGNRRTPSSETSSIGPHHTRTPSW
jgi:hypothetical protein